MFVSTPFTPGGPLSAPPSCSCTASGSARRRSRPSPDGCRRTADRCTESCGPAMTMPTRTVDRVRAIRARDASRPDHRRNHAAERATHRVGRSEWRCDARRHRRRSATRRHRRCVAPRTAHRIERCRLTRRVQAAAARLAVGQREPATVESSAADFVAGLVGAESWAALGTAGRASVVARAGLVGTEVPYFARFEAPSVDDDDVPVVITVGAKSPGPRHEAAERAAELLRGTVVVIPGVGHLPQVEAPDAFAELIRSIA